MDIMECKVEREQNPGTPGLLLKCHKRIIPHKLIGRVAVAYLWTVFQALARLFHSVEIHMDGFTWLFIRSVHVHLLLGKPFRVPYEHPHPEQTDRSLAYG